MAATQTTQITNNRCFLFIIYEVFISIYALLLNNWIMYSMFRFDYTSTDILNLFEKKVTHFAFICS